MADLPGLKEARDFLRAMHAGGPMKPRPNTWAESITKAMHEGTGDETLRQFKRTDWQTLSTSKALDPKFMANRIWSKRLCHETAKAAGFSSGCNVEGEAFLVRMFDQGIDHIIVPLLRKIKQDHPNDTVFGGDNHIATASKHGVTAEVLTRIPNPQIGPFISENRARRARSETKAAGRRWEDRRELRILWERAQRRKGAGRRKTGARNARARRAAPRSRPLAIMGPRSRSRPRASASRSRASASRSRASAPRARTSNTVPKAGAIVPCSRWETMTNTARKEWSRKRAAYISKAYRSQLVPRDRIPNWDTLTAAQRTDQVMLYMTQTCG